MTIRSRPSTDTYRDGWDRVFGPKNQHIPMCQGWDWIVTPEWRAAYESLDSHPAAD